MAPKRKWALAVEAFDSQRARVSARASDTDEVHYALALVFRGSPQCLSQGGGLHQQGLKLTDRVRIVAAIVAMSLCLGDSFEVGTRGSGSLLG